jgi:hypothetical protein
MRLYFVGALTASNEPDAENKESRSCAAFQLMIGVGFV